jgi:hypothetical protein
LDWRGVRDRRRLHCGRVSDVAPDPKLEFIVLDLELGKVRSFHQVDDLLDLL